MSRALLVLCLLAAQVAADPAGEQLFRDGRTLLKAGKIDEACEKFQQSRDVEAKFGTVLNLADCRERQGRFATAWELFLEAKALAQTQKGARDVAEAERRAKLIAGKRAFLTIAIASRVPGLAVTRNGVVVPESTWDQELPIDPGTYAIEANAEGYLPARISVDVAAKGKATATVPALERLPAVQDTHDPAHRTPPLGPPNNAPPPTTFASPQDPRPTTGVTPPVRRASLGVALGGTSDGDLTPGVRAIVQTEAGPGAIRGVFTMQYARLAHDESYSGDNSNLFAFGLGLDYMLAWQPGLASAAGIGIGIDLFTGGLDPNSATGAAADPSTGFWKAVRVSPIIFRFRSRPAELGLHAVIVVQDSPVLIGTAALDWFFW